MSFHDNQNSAGPPSAAASHDSQPSYKTVSHGVASGIFQSNTALSTFQRIVNAIGTSKDTHDLRQKLNRTRQQIMMLVKDISSNLKALNDFSNVSPSQKNADAKLARDFKAILQEFQKAQQLASECESSYMPSGAPASAVINSTSEEADQDIESQPFLSEQKMKELFTNSLPT